MENIDMAVIEFGPGGPDELRLYFTQDEFGDDAARVNFGVLPNNEYVGNTGEWIPVSAERGAEPDVFVVRDNIPADSSFYFTFINDLYGGSPDLDRNVILVKAEINGVEIPAASAVAETQGNYGPYFFNGDTVRPPTEEPGRIITGTAGNDTLTGGGGPDTISGGAGDDRLDGLAGNDVIRAGGGSDLVDGGLGNDTITTSGGVDRIRFGFGQGNDTVTDFAAGTDLVLLSAEAENPVIAETTRDGVSGTFLSFEDDPATLWLPGTTDLTLQMVVG
jgi:Ca2+-binding RTX toxin-like protein